MTARKQTTRKQTERQDFERMFLRRYGRIGWTADDMERNRDGYAMAWIDGAWIGWRMKQAAIRSKGRRN